MSRIGNKPVQIPDGWKVAFENGTVTVQKGDQTLTQDIDPCINVEIKDGQIFFDRKKDDRQARAMHGLYRSLVNNMVVGLTQGFQKELAVQGVGYRAELKGEKLILTLGLSHKVEMQPPQGIQFEVPKETVIIVRGADRQLVGETAAKIRSKRPPEPYKGKGIRYKDEVIQLKVGKTGA